MHGCGGQLACSLRFFLGLSFYGEVILEKEAGHRTLSLAGRFDVVLSVSDKWFFIAKDHISLKRYF